MIRLPVLVERSIADSEVARTEVAEAFKAEVLSHAAEMGSHLSCRKGCSNCCYHPVLMTLLEGLTLYKWLHENGLWTNALKETLKKTARKTHNLPFEVWSLGLIPCPLLDDNGLCKAYEARPFSCRITYSTGDPKNCHPHSLGPGMFPKSAAFEKLTAAETPILRRHHLVHFRLPLAASVLYGELIAQGGLDLDDCQTALWKAPDGI